MQSRELLSGRIGALAGVLFAVLMFFSVAMVDPPYDLADAEVLEWWAQDSNLTAMMVSTFLQIGAVLCFLVFITSLRGVSMRAEGGTGSLTTLAFSAGLLFAGAVLASDGPRAAIAYQVKMHDGSLPGLEILRFLPEIGYVLLGVVGGATAGVAIAVSGILVLRTRALGRWVGFVSLACGPLTAVLALVIGPFYLPILLIWVIATSVALFRAPAVLEAAEQASLAGRAQIAAQ